MTRVPLYRECYIMADYIQLTFSITEETAQLLQQDAATIDDVLSELQRAMAALLSTGLRGAFLDQLQERFDHLLAQLRLLCDESAEAGRDLATVVAMARELDTECALHFDIYSTGLIAELGSSPIAAGGGTVANPDRLLAIDEAIIRLRRIQESTRKHIADIDKQLQNSRFGSWISAAFGYDYHQMRGDLSDSLARTDARIHELEAERVQVEAGLVTASDMAAVSEIQAIDETIDRAAQPEAEQPAPDGFIGNAENLESPARRQYSYQYDVNRNDTYACALYAQAAVMEGMGYNFDEELRAARALGEEEGWFTESGGSTGLGQPLAARNIPYEQYWGEPENGTELISRDDALIKLQSELEAGHYLN